MSKRPSELRDKLSPLAFEVTQKKVTERAYSGLYNDHKEYGLYYCVCCDLALFASEAKYDSGSGWPSFHTPLAIDCVREIRDVSHGMTRIEVVCIACSAHLGHVFSDGPKPTGLRYCINSVSLHFKSPLEAN